MADEKLCSCQDAPPYYALSWDHREGQLSTCTRCGGAMRPDQDEVLGKLYRLGIRLQSPFE